MEAMTVREPGHRTFRMVSPTLVAPSVKVKDVRRGGKLCWSPAMKPSNGEKTPSASLLRLVMAGMGRALQHTGYKPQVRTLDRSFRYGVFLCGCCTASASDSGGPTSEDLSDSSEDEFTFKRGSPVDDDVVWSNGNFILARKCGGGHEQNYFSSLAGNCHDCASCAKKKQQYLEERHCDCNDDGSPFARCCCLPERNACHVGCRQCPAAMLAVAECCCWCHDFQQTGSSTLSLHSDKSRLLSNLLAKDSNQDDMVADTVDGKAEHETAAWTEGQDEPPEGQTSLVHDGKHSLLQFAMYYFRQSPEKFELLRNLDGTLEGSIKMIESIKGKKGKGKKGKEEWTWKELVDMVKFTNSPIQASLLRVDSAELNKLAIECFVAIMRYMGDYPMMKGGTEVECVYTILRNCHKHEALRDEVYCQVMKQTTNNKSARPDSCQRGWRLFSILAAYFTCSNILKPYLFKYLETSAYDKRRAYHGTAMVCLKNLRKTFKYGGRRNVPSVEEITAITAGRNSKRQIYRLPGGTERVINTKSTTVVQDIIEEICAVINVRSQHEMEEFSLYCIVEGDTFTMPLAREEYILDVTTELQKNQQIFYLIFCRSVWYYPLRLDNQLYIEVVFNQVVPDYLEGLLLVMPGEQLQQNLVYDIAKLAALLHVAAGVNYLPTLKETKYLLPKPALAVRDIKPPQWVNMVQASWRDVEGSQPSQVKAQVLEILQQWPLFGSSFFAVKRISDPKERSEHILALNRNGVHFLDLMTHETLIHYTFAEVISTRKVKSEDGTLYLDMKCGNLMQQKITRIQTDQAHEISRLIRQYITIEQRNHGIVKSNGPGEVLMR